jgi:hypothetical protein
MCPLILTAGLLNQDVIILLALCILWNIFIVLLGLGINIVYIFLWGVIRYFQFSRFVALGRLIGTFSLFISTVLGLVSLSFYLMSNGMMFQAINVIFSTLFAASLVMVVMKGSRISDTEQYVILNTFSLIFRIEGKHYKIMIWLVNSLCTTAIQLLFTALIYYVTDILLNDIFQNIGHISGVFIAGAVGCGIILILACCETKEVRPAKRLKVYRLYHCLTLFSVSVSSVISRKINKVASSYKELDKSNTSNHPLNLTVNDVYEFTVLDSESNNPNKRLERAHKWLIQCRNNGGFGLWPKSSSRLYSTYQALSILQKAKLLDKCDFSGHVSWIKKLQQSDGSFKCPFSKRPVWEDTFYAVKSLEILGSLPDRASMNSCRILCSELLIHKGLEKNRHDIIYYCIGALHSLDGIDQDIKKLVSVWLGTSIEKALLTNIGLNYENVHFIVMACRTLETHVEIPQEPLALLTDRILHALEFELAYIR